MMGKAYLLQLTRGGQRTAPWTIYSPLTFIWVPGVETHIVRLVWQVVTEPYYWPRMGCFLYGRMDMTRKRPIGANQLLKLV